MATVVAASHSHRSSPPPLCGSRLRVVDPAPACVVAVRREEEDAADKAATRRRHYRPPRDDEPRRTSTSPSVTRRRRRLEEDHREASPDRKRRRGGESDSRAGYYRRDDDDDAHHRRGRDDVVDRHGAAKRKAGGRNRSGRARDGTGRRSSSRSEERKAYPSAADDVRKPSPVKEVGMTMAEVADEEAMRRRERDDELQRMREEFRRELDKVVRTVWFNDPYTSPLCVLNKMPRWTLRTSEVEEGEVV